VAKKCDSISDDLWNILSAFSRTSPATLLRRGRKQGCQNFSWYKHTKTGNIYQIPTNYNGHKLYQMAVKYSKWSKYILTFSIPRPSKIYPNWVFWFENKPSGNPGLGRLIEPIMRALCRFWDWTPN
jgi:hypothetical protein